MSYVKLAVIVLVWVAANRLVGVTTGFERPEWKDNFLAALLWDVPAFVAGIAITSI